MTVLVGEPQEHRNAAHDEKGADHDDGAIRPVQCLQARAAVHALGAALGTLVAREVLVVQALLALKQQQHVTS